MQIHADENENIPLNSRVKEGNIVHSSRERRVLGGKENINNNTLTNNAISVTLERHNHGIVENNNNHILKETDDEGSHLTAISGTTISSPFITKHIEINHNNNNNNNNEAVTNEKENIPERYEEIEEDKSIMERTDEQILDESRRMSLKRTAPLDDEDGELMEPDQTQEIKRVRVENDLNNIVDDIVDDDETDELNELNELNEVHNPRNQINDQNWDDLDSGDFDDPLMVSEYVGDIFEYLHELELKSMPDPNYLQMQRNLRPKMRSILVDWIVEVHLKFKLLPETLYLSINIMDRFLSKELVQVDRLQLLATGAIFIAAKYEEVYSPSIKNYAYVTDGAFTEDEILGAERFILEILNFNMSYPNPMNFLRRISKADDYDVNSRTIGKYLLEITSVDHKFIGYLPSLCAASAMFISRKMIGKNDWNNNLIHYSGGYKINDFQNIVLMIMDYLISPIIHEEFFKKYASRKFMKVSILARQWAKKINREGKNILEDDV